MVMQIVTSTCPCFYNDGLLVDGVHNRLMERASLHTLAMHGSLLKIFLLTKSEMIYS